MTATHGPGFYDLFVSYSTQDNLPPDPLASAGEREGWVQVFIKRVRALSADFTGEPLTTTANVEPGWDTFYAPDDIHAGHQWETRLRAAIVHTRVLLACLSEHYWQSPIASGILDLERVRGPKFFGLLTLWHVRRLVPWSGVDVRACSGDGIAVRARPPIGFRPSFSHVSAQH